MVKLPPRDTFPLKPTFVRQDQRGLFVEIVNEGPWETVIHGSMKKGAQMGNHYHRECRSYFYLVRGRAEVKIKNLVDLKLEKVVLEAGHGVLFLPLDCHVIRYLEDSDFIFLKSYRFREDQPDIFPYDLEL